MNDDDSSIVSESACRESGSEPTRGYFAPDRPGRRERLRRRLFPSRLEPMPTIPVASDGMITVVDCRFSWTDRARLLVSGRLRVRVHTETENLIGNYAVTTTAFVLPPGEGA